MKIALHGKPQVVASVKSKGILKKENNWKCWSYCSYSCAEVRHWFKLFAAFMLLNTIIQLYIQGNWKKRWKFLLYFA